MSGYVTHVCRKDTLRKHTAKRSLINEWKFFLTISSIIGSEIIAVYCDMNFDHGGF